MDVEMGGMTPEAKSGKTKRPLLLARNFGTAQRSVGRLAYVLLSGPKSRAILSGFVS